MTRILHTYTDIRPDDQLETKRALVTVAYVFVDKLISEKMIEPDDYWSFLLRNWGREDIIIIEQDVVVTYPMIDRLIYCHHKVCTYPYRLAAGQWSVFNIEPDFINHFHTFNLNYYYENKYPARFVDGASLGATKISLAVQKQIPLWEYPVGIYEWWYLDSFISWHLKRLHQRVHVHPQEAKHNRTVEITFQLGDESIIVSNYE